MGGGWGAGARIGRLGFGGIEVGSDGGAGVCGIYFAGCVWGLSFRKGMQVMVTGGVNISDSDWRQIEKRTLKETSLQSLTFTDVVGRICEDKLLAIFLQMR